MGFCDFCTCESCTEGTKGLFHALCVDGRYICDVCYTYDLCTSDTPGGPPRNPSGPCDNKDCIHRPKLIGEWIEFKVPELECSSCGYSPCMCDQQ